MAWSELFDYSQNFHHVEKQNTSLKPLAILPHLAIDFQLMPIKIKVDVIYCLHVCYLQDASSTSNMWTLEAKPSHLLVSTQQLEEKKK